MANLRTNNLSGEQGQNAFRGSLGFHGGENSTDYLQVGSAGDFNYLHEDKHKNMVKLNIQQQVTNMKNIDLVKKNNVQVYGMCYSVSDDTLFNL